MDRKVTGSNGDAVCGGLPEVGLGAFHVALPGLRGVETRGSLSLQGIFPFKGVLLLRDFPL